MSNLYIAEFGSQTKTIFGAPLQLPQLPPVAGQVIAFTASTQSGAMNAETTFVRAISDADCHIEVGVNPTATASSAIKLIGGVPEYFGVTAGHKIAVIKAA